VPVSSWTRSCRSNVYGPSEKSFCVQRIFELCRHQGEPGEVSIGVVVITFYKNDHTFGTCEFPLKPAPRQSYLTSGGYFNFVEKIGDPDFVKYMPMTMSTDLTQKGLSIYFNPAHISTEEFWYQIQNNAVIKQKPAKN
jgi:hypothetical protein